MYDDEAPFIGSEALSSGRVANKHQLRTRYRAIFPDIYLANEVPATLRRRTSAAWLWTGGDGVVSGLAASAMHGSRWVDDDVPVELMWPNGRAPRGMLTRRDRLLGSELQAIDGMWVTTAARTAFDIGRRGALGARVARLDALGNATRVGVHEVMEVARRHPGSPGVRRLPTALELYDRGAESPRETWLRLLLMKAGFPRPQTQIPVLGPDGWPLYYLDMGWEDILLAVEYDGDHHRERVQFGKDIIRSEYISDRRWTRVRVVAGTSEATVIDRVGRAWESCVRSDRRHA